jgi:hypothetical protein
VLFLRTVPGEAFFVLPYGGQSAFSLSPAETVKPVSVSRATSTSAGEP